MADRETYDRTSLEQLAGKLQSLEDRISKLESVISSEYAHGAAPPLSDYDDEIEEWEERVSGDFFETNIGKYGLGWLANIVFIFGIIFVMSFVHSKGFITLSYSVGFIGVLSMFVFSHLIRKTFTYISYLIKICALLLLFYITASLHFFSEEPLIASRIFVLFLLLLVIGGQLVFAVRRNSEALAGIGIFMLLITAVLSDTTHLMLPLISLAAITAVSLLIRHEWWRLLLLSIPLVYFTHILWMFNNPFAGNTSEAVSTHQYSLVYLFLYGAVFSLPMILRHWRKTRGRIFSAVMIINALSFFGTLMIAINFFYAQNYVWIFTLITVVCLLYSISLKLRSNLSYAPAFYACFGFIALSAAIYGYYDLPKSYFLLALQSFLVVSMAIWYRSTVIVVANTLLFLYLLLFYMITTDPMDSVNFSFAFVGLATARILNWKKERLALRTEIFRNIYLVASFFIVLYALYHAAPPDYVTLAWTGAAILYFVFSFILKNVKYRWMAIGTLIVTAFYLFLVDLKNMAMEYRVIAFLFLAIILLAVSMYYAKRIMRKKNEE